MPLSSQKPTFLSSVITLIKGPSNHTASSHQKGTQFAMDMYRLLYLKWITNDDLLYSTPGTQLSVLWQPGWEGVWGRMNTCMYVAKSLAVHLKLPQHC